MFGFALETVVGVVIGLMLVLALFVWIVSLRLARVEDYMTDLEERRLTEADAPAPAMMDARFRTLGD